MSENFERFQPPHEPEQPELNPRELDLEPGVDGEREDLVRIEEVAKRYHFEKGKVETGYLFSDSMFEQNKVFLAMLDEYIPRAVKELPEKDELQMLDFGSGNMTYQNAYRVFFERYGIKMEDEARKTKITAWDCDPDLYLSGPIDSIYERLESPGQVETYINKGFIAKEIDILTMFGIGPGSELMDPEAVEISFQKAIRSLSPFLNKDGFMIMTTSLGGPKKTSLLRFLKESGLEVILDEKNRYEQKLGMRLGFNHEDVIIARKKTKDSKVESTV